jgi:hypothetical protein
MRKTDEVIDNAHTLANSAVNNSRRLIEANAVTEDIETALEITRLSTVNLGIIMQLSKLLLLKEEGRGD